MAQTFNLSGAKMSKTLTLAIVLVVTATMIVGAQSIRLDIRNWFKNTNSMITANRVWLPNFEAKGKEIGRLLKMLGIGHATKLADLITLGHLRAEKMRLCFRSGLGTNVTLNIFEETIIEVAIKFFVSCATS